MADPPLPSLDDTSQLEFNDFGTYMGLHMLGNDLQPPPDPSPDSAPEPERESRSRSEAAFNRTLDNPPDPFDGSLPWLDDVHEYSQAPADESLATSAQDKAQAYSGFMVPISSPQSEDAMFAPSLEAAMMHTTPQSSKVNSAPRSTASPLPRTPTQKPKVIRTRGRLHQSPHTPIQTPSYTPYRTPSRLQHDQTPPSARLQKASPQSQDIGQRQDLPPRDQLVRAICTQKMKDYIGINNVEVVPLHVKQEFVRNATMRVNHAYSHPHPQHPPNQSSFQPVQSKTAYEQAIDIHGGTNNGNNFTAARQMSEVGAHEQNGPASTPNVQQDVLPLNQIGQELRSVISLSNQQYEHRRQLSSGIDPTPLNRAISGHVAKFLAVFTNLQPLFQNLWSVNDFQLQTLVQSLANRLQGVLPQLKITITQLLRHIADPDIRWATISQACTTFYTSFSGIKAALHERDRLRELEGNEAVFIQTLGIDRRQVWDALAPGPDDELSAFTKGEMRMVRLHATKGVTGHPLLDLA